MDNTLSSSPHGLRRFFYILTRACWHGVRLPILTLLVILEPIVTFVFMGLALLGVLMSLFNRYVLALPHFPFVLMLSISVGFALCLVPYYLLIRWLSR